MKEWHKAVIDRTSLPSWVTLKRIPEERIYLYCQVQTQGENIPISVKPFQVEELVPTEEEIKWAVRRLWNNCSRGPLGVRAEHLKW